MHDPAPSGGPDTLRPHWPWPSPQEAEEATRQHQPSACWHEAASARPRVPEGEWAPGEDFREERAGDEGDKGIFFMDDRQRP